jgi:citrate lyase subunit beta/citryl-CoA lyase
MLEKAQRLVADAIIIDLEDSVAPNEKNLARSLAQEWIPRLANNGGTVYVRVNAIETGLLHQDLEAIVHSHLSGIIIPKSENPGDIVLLDNQLSNLEMLRGLPVGHTQILCIIESAKGVWNSYWIGLSSPRIAALAFGAVDYTRDMRVRLTTAAMEQDFARCRVAMGARAAGVLAIDSAWPFFRDVDAFTLDCCKSRQMGYEGRLLIHPIQIEPAERIYGQESEDILRDTANQGGR